MKISRLNLHENSIATVINFTQHIIDRKFFDAREICFNGNLDYQKDLETP